MDSPQTARTAHLDRHGSNEILIKVGSGSQGFGFSVSLAKLPLKGTPQESRIP